MGQVIKPLHYEALLDTKQTEQGIKLIKDFFQQNLSTELRLRRVTAPLFVLKGLGINDDLNGVERAVTFPIKDLGDAQAEVVHSLAKWKRLSLAEYRIEPGYGIYTDMNAIRADEELDNLHSLYVDQWDWEAVIRREDRTLSFLKNVVERIYAAIRRTEYLTCETYPQIKAFLPEKIHFIHAEELLKMYPDKTPKEREDAICEAYGAVFIIGIGGKLSNGEKHDGRAPDYDDWSTIAENGKMGLNGDILIWYPILGRSFELSSMGIRVDKESLLRQLKLEHKEEREDAICEAYGAVFVIGIGGKLSNGEKHDGRAPDYDDWSTIAENGKMGLNGDILIWYPILGRSFELSSMGIRVDKESLLRQLKLEHKEEREQLYFHQQLLNDRLPLSIGGGIGQSRLCMVLLHKGHIGEIQASIWPDDMRRECKALGMTLI